jgi:predicted  nucleic acid-binding Zn-ribbon protein
VDPETRSAFEGMQARLDAMQDQLDGTRSDLSDFRGETRHEFTAVRREMAEEFVNVRREIREEVSRVGVIVEALRGDIRAVADGILAVADSVTVLRADMAARFRATEAVMHASFAAVRADIDDLRRRMAGG